MRLPLQWTGLALIPIVIDGCSTTATLAATEATCLVPLELVIAVVTLGAAVSRSTARRRACLQALETLLRAAPRTGKR
jgi:uncharacterized membrane protein